MLTSLEFIHLLNTRIAAYRQKLSRTASLPIRPTHSQIHSPQQRVIRLQAIWATIALIVGSLGQIAPIRANTLDFAGIRQSLKLSTSNPANLNTPKTRLTQNTTTPASPEIKLPNDLNLPQTGAQVQVTGNQSITLQQALDLALRNNREIQAARLTVDRSQTGIRQAQAAQSIQVGLTGTLQNQGSPLIIGNQPQFGNSNNTDASGTLQASYNILSAGRNQSQVRAAEEQVRFDRLDLVRIEQLVRGQVNTAYYDLQAADSLVIINQAAVRDATRSLSDAQLQERAGVGTRFDILRAQVQLATANQDLTNAQGQQQTARKRIAQILVVDTNTEFRAADPVKELGSWSYSLEDSIVTALKNRPELQQQLALRSISEQRKIVSASADSPQVDLFANYTLGKSLSSSVAAQDNYSLGARLTWNFFDGGGARAGADSEQISQSIFENRFTTNRNQIRFEVEQAFFSLGSNQKNISTATQALQQAEESLKLARLRFQAGVGTQTDVIQSQTALARSRGDRITAIINYNRSLSNLRTATLLAE